MIFGGSIFLGLIALVGISFLIAFLAHHFCTEARLERRRRKSHSRIVNKSRRPAISLNVNTKEDSRE